MSRAIYLGQTASVPLFEMYVDGLTYRTGRVHARATIPSMLALLASGRPVPTPVTTAVIDWERAPDGLTGSYTRLVMARE